MDIIEKKTNCMGFRDATKRRFPLDTVLGIVRILEDPIDDAKRLGLVFYLHLQARKI